MLKRSSLLQDMTRREQYGHIINISSMSAHRVPNGASGGSFYAATKHALRAITEGLRQEVRACLFALYCLFLPVIVDPAGFPSVLLTNTWGNFKLALSHMLLSTTWNSVLRWG